MALVNIAQAKELVPMAYKPCLLAEMLMYDGSTLRVSEENFSSVTGGVQYGGFDWQPRIMNHTLSALQANSDGGVILSPTFKMTLADADGFFWNTYEIPPGVGFKGAKLTLFFVFYDPIGKTFSSDQLVRFVGICNAPTEANDTELNLLFTNILNLANTYVPNVQISRTCPWAFPTTLAQRQDGADNPDSPFYNCGYSPDASGSNARGNLIGGVAATSCDLSWQTCINLMGNSALPTSVPFGSFSGPPVDSPPVQIEQDKMGRHTGRFGGSRYDPPLAWRGKAYISGTTQQAINNPNDNKFNDYFPMVWGTAFVNPPVMCTNGNPNSTRMEVTICLGQIWSGLGDPTQIVQQVVVNDVLVPYTSEATDSIMHWDWVNTGGRDGYCDVYFDKMGDPYGSIACIMIEVPVEVTGSASIPQVQILTRGPQVRVWNSNNIDDFTRMNTTNSIWNIVDMLCWGPFQMNDTQQDMDLNSILLSATAADSPVTYVDLLGNTDTHPRYQIGFAARDRRTMAQVVKNVLAGCRCSLAPSSGTDPSTAGLLQVFVWQTLADQQPSPIYGSNNPTPIASASAADDGGSITEIPGYSAYSFNESNILKKSDAKSSSTFRILQRPISDTPNKLSIPIQDEDYNYSPDSINLTVTEDVARAGQTIQSTIAAEGVVNLDQAKRIIQNTFARQMFGNPRTGFVDSNNPTGTNDTGGTWICEFDASFRAIHLRVGHIIDITYQKYGLNSQLFRILALTPSPNCERITIRAEWHEDDWYLDSYGQNPDPILQRLREQALLSPPWPWMPDETAPQLGDAAYDPTEKSMALNETFQYDSDGNGVAMLEVTGVLPVNTFTTLTGPPYITEAETDPTGGTVNDGVYYLCLAAIDNVGEMTTLSWPPVKVSVGTGTGGPGTSSTITVPNIYWMSGTAGWNLYAGLNPNVMSLQSTGSGTPSSVTINEYKVADAPPSDRQFDHLKILVKNVAYQGSGIYGFTAISVGASSFQYRNSTDLSVPFPTNFLQGLLIYCASFAESSEDLSYNTWVITSNDDTMINVSLLGGAIPDLTNYEAGDVFYVRANADISTATTIGCSKYPNVSEQATYPIQLTDASNTSPIIIGCAAGHGVVSGNNILVSGIGGNTAANGYWVASLPSTGMASYDATHIILANAWDPVAMTSGAVSAGNGDYESGTGMLQILINGLNVNFYIGDVVRIIGGTGRGQWRNIVSNTNTTLTVDTAWNPVPDPTSIFIIEEPTWVDSQNSVPQQVTLQGTETTIQINVTNLIRFGVGDGIVLQAFTCNSDESLISVGQYSPVRDMWLQPPPPGPYQIEKATWNLATARSIAVGIDVAPHYSPMRVWSPSTCTYKAKIPPTGADLIMDIILTKADGSYTGSIFTTPLVVPAASDAWQTVPAANFVPDVVFNQGDTLTANVIQVGSLQPGSQITIIVKGVVQILPNTLS